MKRKPNQSKERRRIIRKMANDNKVDDMDLDYAVKALFAHEDNKKIEAATYEDLVKEKTNYIWKIAQEAQQEIKLLGKG